MTQFDVSNNNVTQELLAELRKKAEEASENSEGRWGLTDHPETGKWGLCVHDQGDIIIRSALRDKDWTRKVLTHIAAADPAVVLRLVSEIERLQEEARLISRHSIELTKVAVGFEAELAKAKIEIAKLRGKNE